MMSRSRRVLRASAPAKQGMARPSVRARNDPELRVSDDVSAAGDRYREVWLINSDGQRMYSLGVLPESGPATYPLPTLLADGLDGFTIVDVSIEPYDGNPSTHATVRFEAVCRGNDGSPASSVALWMP